MKEILKLDHIQKYYGNGGSIRKAIKEAGGTMPEDLPTPDKSLKELEKNKNLIVKNRKGGN